MCDFFRSKQLAPQFWHGCLFRISGLATEPTSKKGGNPPVPRTPFDDRMQLGDQGGPPLRARKRASSQRPSASSSATLVPVASSISAWTGGILQSYSLPPGPTASR